MSPMAWLEQIKSNIYVPLFGKVFSNNAHEIPEDKVADSIDETKFLVVSEDTAPDAIQQVNNVEMVAQERIENTMPEAIDDIYIMSFVWSSADG